MQRCRDSRRWNQGFLVILMSGNKTDHSLEFQFTFGFRKFRNKGNDILNILFEYTAWGKKETILKLSYFCIRNSLL